MKSYFLFMKRSILIFAVALCSFTAEAQSKIYCDLTATSNLFSSKISVYVDFGQETSLLSDDRLVDENGNILLFNSMIDAMNYMSTLGWEFEQTYVVPTGSESKLSGEDHWLMSKHAGEKGENAKGFRTKNMIMEEKADTTASVKTVKPR